MCYARSDNPNTHTHTDFSVVFLCSVGRCPTVVSNRVFVQTLVKM